MKKSFLSIFILVAISCGTDKRPTYLMSHDEMVNYLIELHIAEATVQNFRLSTDSAKVVFDAQEKYLLKTHNLTDSIFVESYNYYLDHPLELEEIYGAVVDSLSLMQSLSTDE